MASQEKVEEVRLDDVMDAAAPASCVDAVRAYDVGSTAAGGTIMADVGMAPEWRRGYFPDGHDEFSDRRFGVFLHEM